MEEKDRLDTITRRIIGAAIEVHKHLGPGLLESAYESCLVYELRERDLAIERQKPFPIKYKEVLLDCGYRLDLVVQSLLKSKQLTNYCQSMMHNCFPVSASQIKALDCS